MRTVLKSFLVIAAMSALAAMAGSAHSQKAIRKTGLAERSPSRGTPYATRDDAMQWADELAQRRGLDPAWVHDTLARAQMLPVVSRLMQPAPPGMPKNWQAYRSRFVEPVRIAAGLKFWKDNEATLARAEQEFGVPAEIIVGIIGVETLYGQQMGNFRVIDALATLSFDFPASHPRAAERTKYFRGELEEFMVMQRLSNSNPLQALGSYAGAMGMPQFMPSSWMNWAVDFDGDRRIDLAGSPADVIGSVANYFKSYGWQPGMPTHYPVSFDPATLDKEALLAPDILPTFSVESFTAKGAVLAGPALEHPRPLALIELQNGENPPQYVAGTENFYVVTRYNWSSYYAMAVIELGREVKAARNVGIGIVIDLAAWRATWIELGARQPHDALHQQLIACWSEKHRRYHTLQHLLEIMEQFEEVRGLAKRPAEIVLALWFHDAFYDPTRDDNEERSAQWARESVRQALLPEDVAQRLYELVMATRHEEIPSDADAQLLVDVDLAILGADSARFEESNAQVREEYAHVPEQEYRLGRRKVLRNFLDRPRLYGTDRFHSMLEKRARENLQRELDRLQG